MTELDLGNRNSSVRASRSDRTLCQLRFIAVLVGFLADGADLVRSRSPESRESGFLLGSHARDNLREVGSREWGGRNGPFRAFEFACHDVGASYWSVCEV